ncbi:MAG: histidine kinase dimerization/phospho-acceptor domain-containing protein [Bacteroidales bacterium]
MKPSTEPMKHSHVKEINSIDASERISFLSHISHGIRTPLNSIMGFSRLLAKRSIVDEKQRDYLEGILNGSELLLQFVENIIDLSQFQSDNYLMTFDKYNVQEKLWQFVEEFNSLKKEDLSNDIQLHISCGEDTHEIFFITDISLLKKSLLRLINLISTKYDEQEFEIGFRVTEDDWIQFFVAPLKVNHQQDEILSPRELYSGIQDNSFDYFNYQVLLKSVEIMNGELIRDTSNHEFSFKIPIDIRKYSNQKMN